MKTGANEEYGLPLGYELVRLDAHTQLALPSEAARASRLELELREEALEVARREDLQRQQLEKKLQVLAADRAKAEQAKAELRARKVAFSPVPAPGWYRVLPDLNALLEEGAGLALRSADKDVNERQSRVRETLVAKGPDRRIARPADWRQAIDELEAALPHFRGPTRLLRNSLALAEATDRPVRVPPMLLLGPPGVGKTHFSHRVAEMMGAAHAAITFDQPSAGAQLRGSDKYWSNSESGLLFNLICMGDCANPVVLLDELDKSMVGSGRQEMDPLAQLHGALEPQTSRRMQDVSLGIEFDASLVTYIATANSVRGVGLPILSRMEVFSIEPPSISEAFEIAQAIVEQTLRRLALPGEFAFMHRAVCVLAHLSPRLMVRTTEKAVAAALASGRNTVGESDVCVELGLEPGPEHEGPRLH